MATNDKVDTLPVSLRLPAGVLIAAIGAIGAYYAATQPTEAGTSDVAIVDARIEAAANQIRREVYASDVSAEALAVARYDEILRRLDRIERRMDGAP